jgi:hypothetical protein
VRYLPIAAAAPAATLPEQAPSWAYPQPGTTWVLLDLTDAGTTVGDAGPEVRQVSPRA